MAAGLAVGAAGFIWRAGAKFSSWLVGAITGDKQTLKAGCLGAPIPAGAMFWGSAPCSLKNNQEAFLGEEKRCWESPRGCRGRLREAGSSHPARSRRLLAPSSSKGGSTARFSLWQSFAVALSDLALRRQPPGGLAGGGFAVLVQLRTVTRRLCRSWDRTPPRRRYRARRGSDACRFEERSPSWGDDCCPPRPRGREQHRARQHQHRCRKRRTRSCSSASSVSSSRNERGGAWGPNPSPLLAARSAPGEYLCPLLVYTSLRGACGPEPVCWGTGRGGGW